MKYAMYTDYLESPLDWVGAIPAHWEIKKIGHLALLKSGENIVSEEIAEGGEYPVFGGNGFRGYFNQYTHEGNFVLIGRQGALCGNINYASGMFWASEHALVAHPLAEFDVHWFGETLRAMRLNQYSVSAAQPGLAASAISALRLPFPPLVEQKAIAHFLDTKTAQIDTLVAQKRQLIARLKEKRSALIARTVTRGLPPEAAKAVGLNPNPTLKNSGVQWLTQLPEHWVLSPLKRVVSMPITDGPHETPEFPPEGIPFVSAEAVQDGRVHLSSMRGYISREAHAVYSKKYCPKRDDIFIVKSGSTTGKVAIVDFDDEFNVWSPLAAVRCDLKKAHPAFLFFALSSEYFQGLVQVSWSFGTQPNIGMGVIGNLTVVLPPPAEQVHIAAFLKVQTERFGTLLARAQTAIDRLTEYRQALITSAVTGKIDVREAT